MPLPPPPPPHLLTLTLPSPAFFTKNAFGATEIFSEDGDEAGPLSEEDENMIASILDIPAFAGADSLDVGVVCWADGSSAGSISLAPSVFGVPVRRDVVHDVVRWQLARRRKGNGQVCACSTAIGPLSGNQKAGLPGFLRCERPQPRLRLPVARRFCAALARR